MKRTCAQFAIALVAITAVNAVTLPVRADGETLYDPAVCGGPDGTVAPTFTKVPDFGYLLGAIAQYAANPTQLFVAPPADLDPWTNWWLEEDIRDQLAKLAVMRGILDKFNLWDTYVGWFPPAACAGDAETVRTLDGTCNDLVRPFMGARGARFGRNILPLQPAAFPDPTTMLSPNPREVSRQLFARDEGFKEVPFLNLLAAAWIQFQIHDWFNHELDPTGLWQIPLADDDPFREDQEFLYVKKTLPDPTRLAHEAVLPPTYQNEVTHWWDGSQIYGSDAETAAELRKNRRGVTVPGGKLAMNRRGMLPKEPDGFEKTGFRDNWWVGLGLMHNLFALEHNAIAEMLADEYPAMSDDEIFDKARMINAAVIVKIHTIEWTPAILPNPALEAGMNANWEGLNQYFDPPLEPTEIPPSLSSVVDGVAGNARDLKVYPTSAELQAQGVPAGQADQIAAVFAGDVPYSLTEEFVSVYRMHTLLPDVVKLWRYNHRKDRYQRRGVAPLNATRDARARRLQERLGLSDLLYSFGVEHPGQIVLQNYPRLLQNLKIKLPVIGKVNLDIGAIDVLRDRERGVPRYNEFRRQLRLPPIASIDQLTPDPELRAKLKDVYGDDAGAIERVDALVGTLAEGTRPLCYGFGETLFQVFTVMATRRIQADRFYTDDFTPAVYTEAGMDWIRDATMKGVLLRHFPELGPAGLDNVTNAFYPWDQAAAN